MEGWVDLGYPAMYRPGVELAIFRPIVPRRVTLPSGDHSVPVNVRPHFLVEVQWTALEQKCYAYHYVIIIMLLLFDRNKLNC